MLQEKIIVITLLTGNILYLIQISMTIDQFVL